VSGSQPDLGELLRQAQAMQESLSDAQAAVAEEEVQGRSGGGAVTITVTGGMEFRSVSIDPSAVDPSDVTMLEDLVLAALHDAVARVSALNESNLGSVGLGGLNLGELMSGLGMGPPEGEGGEARPQPGNKDG
jgi:nucleoid-associated protein EbfC